MARPDFYVVLGVDPDDPPERIRAAFRRLAKRHHPDRAGGHDTGRFREISEAYRTLSDPEARRAYDASRGGGGGRKAANGGWAPPAELVEGLNVDVVLSPEEAMLGVVVPIEVPTPSASRVVHLRLRPPVLSGAVHEIWLDHLGVRNFLLRVRPVVS